MFGPRHLIAALNVSDMTALATSAAKGSSNLQSAPLLSSFGVRSPRWRSRDCGLAANSHEAGLGDRLRRRQEIATAAR